MYADGFHTFSRRFLPCWLLRPVPSLLQRVSRLDFHASGAVVTVGHESHQIRVLGYIAENVLTLFHRGEWRWLDYPVVVIVASRAESCRDDEYVDHFAVSRDSLYSFVTDAIRQLLTSYVRLISLNPLPALIASRICALFFSSRGLPR